MAVQCNFTDGRTGATYDSAYCTINNVSANKNELGILDVSISIQVFANKTSYDNILRSVCGFNAQLQVQTSDSVSLALLYGYLKTLPQFAGAIDV